MSCSHGRWFTRADALLGVEGLHVGSVTVSRAGLVLGVETGEDVTGCPDCGVVAVSHGRRRVRLHDIPCFGRPVRLLWAKRVWRCPDPDCPRTTFTEEHSLAGSRAKLTALAAGWATDPLRFDTSVWALAHQLGVDEHVWSHRPARHQDGHRHREPHPRRERRCSWPVTGCSWLMVKQVPCLES
ncbi:MAG: family transposase [Pseudarthrobacter sp.]|nr:family transposase [Pseudarthrobacter sp.]